MNFGAVNGRQGGVGGFEQHDLPASFVIGCDSIVKIIVMGFFSTLMMVLGLSVMVFTAGQVTYIHPIIIFIARLIKTIIA